MEITTHNKNRLVLPWAGSIYNAFEPLVWPIVRISLGLMLMPHGYDKLFLNGAANTARNPILHIFISPVAGAYFIGGVEFFGGLLLALRWLAPTRLRAAGAAAGLAAGAWAACLYCLHCPETAAPFILVWYSAGITLATGLGALLGPRLLRW